MSRMTISVTVDTNTLLDLHLSTMSMIHYGMVLGVFKALAVSSTLLWFCKDLPHPTSEDIELRLCLSESTSNEDVAFEVVEIYVQ